MSTQDKRSSPDPRHSIVPFWNISRTERSCTCLEGQNKPKNKKTKNRLYRLLITVFWFNYFTQRDKSEGYRMFILWSVQSNGRLKIRPAAFAIWDLSVEVRLREFEMWRRQSSGVWCLYSCLEHGKSLVLSWVVVIHSDFSVSSLSDTISQY